ncbi:hypothetical protein FHG87_014316 [Trinorchestia longiramus]|nr:hypothetical protein FHG87_014316 [Trinorchestia longiramus]
MSLAGQGRPCRGVLVTEKNGAGRHGGGGKEGVRVQEFRSKVLPANMVESYSRPVVPNLFVIKYHLEVPYSSGVPPGSRETKFDQMSLYFHNCTSRTRRSTKKTTTQCEGCIYFFSTSWSMRSMTLLTAHRKSCSGASRRFRLFDLMVMKTENPCSHSHVEGVK